MDTHLLPCPFVVDKVDANSLPAESTRTANTMNVSLDIGFGVL